jgi:hypothetical protein
MEAMRNIIFLFACILISCTRYPAEIEATLNMAGNNRHELERVLKHYGSNPADSLKLRAAEFLIVNMGFSQYACDTASLHLYRPILRDLDSLLQTSSTDHLREQWAMLKKRYPLQKHVHHHVYPDMKHITSGYLISDMDLATATWQHNPYGDSISFRDFLEYVLPYRS